jgi:Chalcone isomerase-like
MRRRGMLALANCASAPAAAAEPDFPDTVSLDGTRLVRNGIGERRYLGVLVYRAALFLPAPLRDARAILDAAGPKLLRLRYARAVPAGVARNAWQDSYAGNCRCPPPAALLDWVRDLAPGDVEAYAIAPDHARISGPGRAEVVLAGAAAARDLLACWFGPAPPTEALQRGLLGPADRAALSARSNA